MPMPNLINVSQNTFFASPKFHVWIIFHSLYFFIFFYIFSLVSPVFIYPPRRISNLIHPYRKISCWSDWSRKQQAKNKLCFSYHAHKNVNKNALDSRYSQFTNMTCVVLLFPLIFRSPRSWWCFGWWGRCSAPSVVLLIRIMFFYNISGPWEYILTKVISSPPPSLKFWVEFSSS